MTTQPTTEGTTANNINDGEHWNSQRAKLKLKFPALTSNDLYFKHGQKEAMMNKLCTKLHKTKEELETIIAAL